MITLWMLSAIMFTAFLAVAAWWAERALRAAGRQTRGVWLFALATGTLWPVLVPVLRHMSPEPAPMSAGVAMLDVVRIAPGGVASTVAWLPIADRLLLGLWIAGSLLLLARYASVWRAVRALRRTAEWRRVDGVEVLVSRDVGPAVVGVRNAAVLLPHAVLELDASLRALVLRHEEEHRRAHDTWLLLTLALAVAAVPWNLPLWWIAHRARLALEVDCDARVLAAGGSVTRYVQVLLLAAQRTSAAPLTPMLVASRTHLERRIVAMQERIAQQMEGRRRTLRIVGATAACAVALAVACSSPIADQTAAPNSPDVTSSAARTSSSNLGRQADQTTAPEASMTVTSETATSTLDHTPEQGQQPVNVNQPYFEFQVEKQVRTAPGSPQPRYPVPMKKAGVSGEVLAQFIVDTTGRADVSTFKVLKTDRQEFADAVREILPSMRFYPAEIRGTKVKQMVQQPFTFAISK